MADREAVQLQPHVSLRSANSFGLEATAELFARATRVEALAVVLAQVRERCCPLTVLGGGSNVILQPWLPGCVLQVALRGIDIVADPDDGDGVLVTAAAGERWHDLVRFCIGQGLAGIENLALIPGNVGAAPVQNIGAYGIELAQRLVWVDAVCRDSGQIRRFSHADCAFGYRDSAFKQGLRNRYLVTAITLRLSRRWTPVDDYPDLRQELLRMAGPASMARLAEAVVRVRRRKLPDPRRTGNAGSVFENPVVDAGTFERLSVQLPGLAGFPAPAGIKIPAARLIEACGWKGRRRGGAAVWHRQPLVLVNAGAATAADVLGLAAAIRDSVQARFGVMLEFEVQVLGQPRRPPS